MGGGGGWEYSNVLASDVGYQSEFDLLIWKLQGDTGRNLYLTQKSTDGEFFIIWDVYKER